MVLPRRVCRSLLLTVTPFRVVQQNMAAKEQQAMPMHMQRRTVSMATAPAQKEGLSMTEQYARVSYQRVDAHLRLWSGPFGGWRDGWMLLHKFFAQKKPSSGRAAERRRILLASACCGRLSVVLPSLAHVRSDLTASFRLCST